MIKLLHASDLIRNLFIPEGKKYVYTSVDCTIRVYQREGSLKDNTQCLHLLEGHTQPITCLYHCDGMLFSGSQDSLIRIWSIERKKTQCIRVLSGHKGGVKCIDASQHIILSGDVCEQCNHRYTA